MTEQAWTTTITKIDPIPGKDRIVLATVEGYQINPEYLTRKSGTEYQ